MYIHDKVEIEESPLGIPYFRPKDDLNSHSYVNLRAEPDQITALPELQKSVPLREFVAALNAVGSRFETFGCEKWASPWTHDQFPGFNTRHGSYVDFALCEKLQCGSPDTYFALIEELRSYSAANPIYDVIHIHFTLRKTGGYDLAWWSLCVWNYGIGRSDKEAEKWWAEGLRYFQTFMKL
jgi:hypothetical protein